MHQCLMDYPHGLSGDRDTYQHLFAGPGWSRRALGAEECPGGTQSTRTPRLVPHYDTLGSTLLPAQALLQASLLQHCPSCEESCSQRHTPYSPLLVLGCFSCPPVGQTGIPHNGPAGRWVACRELWWSQRPCCSQALQTIPSRYCL